MNKIIVLIMFLAFGKVFCQTDRYIYQTEANPDTINLVDMKVEKTFLDVSKTQTLFISESRLLRDSLRSTLKLQEKQEIKKSKKDKPDFPKLADGKSIQPTFFEYFIIKDLAGNSVNLVENVGPKQVYYQEDRKLNWEITPQTSEYKGYKIQKATVNFGGRNWTAWFSLDIKLSDGPYKFYGLPGLILKLEDDKGDYRFSFLKKVVVPNAYQEQIIPDARKSNRINFAGDKASVRMELSKNKDSQINLDQFNPGGGRGMHQRNGAMNGGFNGPPGGNGGMPNGEMGGAPNMGGMPAATSGQNTGFTNFGNTNPIELTNK